MEAMECSAMARETPHFVKVYFPDLCSDHLKIPPAFRGCIEHESPGTVSLKGPGGRTWTVELVKSQKGLLFESGWKEFVADHSITPGDFLVFRYEGRLHFSVLIFDATACEKETAFLARPYRERITIVDGSEGGEEGKALEEDIAIVDGSEGGEEGKALEEDIVDGSEGGEEGKALEEDITIVDGSEGREEGKALEEDVTIVDGSREGKALEKHITIIVIGSESDEEGKALEEHDSKALVLSPSGSSGVGRKRTRRSTGCLEIEDRPLKKEKNKGVASIFEVDLDSSKSKEETPGRINPLSGALTTLQRYKTVKKQRDKLNNARTKQGAGRPAKTRTCSATTAESLHKKLVRPSKKRVSKQSSQDSERLELLECNYVPRSGEVGAKERRMPTIISQRRLATEEDVNKMFELVKSFKSKNPFVHVVMQESYVYTGFFLNIPFHFVRDYLPKVNKKITLWDPNGKPWAVNFVNYGNRGGFSAGWGKFSIANNLEKHDICVFELIKRNQMKVHIFRVVKKIAPLLRNTKRKS